MEINYAPDGTQNYRAWHVRLLVHHPGIKAVKVAPWRIRTDADALAYALYLERQGKNDEAECFLERYLQQKQ